MRKRIMLLLCVAVVLGAAPIASAHEEQNGKETSRCDSWWRRGHFVDQTGGPNNTPDGKPDEPYNGSHEHNSTSDINELSAVAGTEIHSHSGHHVVRNDYGYVEVVGGQAYKGPHPNGKFFPGQGGFVQGELDVAGVPEVEFLVAFFGPNTDDPPVVGGGDPVAWANGSYGKVCVDTLGERIEHQTRTP